MDLKWIFRKRNFFWGKALVCTGFLSFSCSLPLAISVLIIIQGPGRKEEKLKFRLIMLFESSSEEGWMWWVKSIVTWRYEIIYGCPSSSLPHLTPLNQWFPNIGTYFINLFQLHSIRSFVLWYMSSYMS